MLDGLVVVELDGLDEVGPVEPEWRGVLDEAGPVEADWLGAVTEVDPVGAVDPRRRPPAVDLGLEPGTPPIVDGPGLGAGAQT